MRGASTSSSSTRWTIWAGSRRGEDGRPARARGAGLPRGAGAARQAGTTSASRATVFTAPGARPDSPPRTGARRRRPRIGEHVGERHGHALVGSHAADAVAAVDLHHAVPVLRAAEGI